MVYALHFKILNHVRMILQDFSKYDFPSIFKIVASKFLNDEGEDDEIFNDEWAVAGMFIFSFF